MDLRITLATQVNRTLSATRRQTDRLAQLQEQAATGKRLLRPSDAPGDTQALLTSKAEDARLGALLDNLRTARSELDAGVSALREAQNLFTRARQIAAEGSHSGNTPVALEALATEVDGLLDRLLALANDTHEGRYLFSGTATATTPFVVTARDGQGRPLAVSYQGSTQRGQVTVQHGLTVDVKYPGSHIFQARSRQQTIFTTNTGAAPGTGTDSATGEGTLLVRHTTTTYAPGSGILAGASSASGDTILGPPGAHRLHVTDTSGTGAAGTVSLNGGPPISFSSADTDLRVLGPGGEVVYVNTTAIAPGFDGDVDITANGSLSVDGGATSLPIDFSTNQVVSDSTTGAVTDVDSSNIRQTGTADLNYAGTYDSFGILMALRDDLRNVRGLSEHEQLESLAGRLGELDRAADGFLSGVSEQSVSLQSLERIEDYLGRVQLDTRIRTTELEGADLAEVVVNLQTQQNLLQLTLASTARLFDQSLLDFLR